MTRLLEHSLCSFPTFLLGYLNSLEVCETLMESKIIIEIVTGKIWYFVYPQYIPLAFIKASNV